MKINVCDYYWKCESDCSTCLCNIPNIGYKDVDKEKVIQNLEETKENIQKLLDRLRKL